MREPEKRSGVGWVAGNEKIGTWNRECLDKNQGRLWARVWVRGESLGSLDPTVCKNTVGSRCQAIGLVTEKRRACQVQRKFDLIKRNTHYTHYIFLISIFIMSARNSE